MNNSKYSTVIVTDKHSQETKIYTVKQKHISNIKLYKSILMGSIVCVLIILSSLISYIGYSYTQKKLLHGKIADLETKLDDNKMKEMANNLSQAEEALLKIEKYLQDREVKTLSSSYDGNNTDSGVGGEYYPADILNPDLISSQKERISDLLNKIQSIPIGLPHYGRLSSDFGVRGNPISGRGGEFHPGLDIAGQTGAPIRVTANGEVIFAGVKGGYGNCIVVKHGFKYETLYGHLSKINVRAGQKLKSGDIIGLLGSTGRSTGPHVHYEIIHNQEKINPKHHLSIIKNTQIIK